LAVFSVFGGLFANWCQVSEKHHLPWFVAQTDAAADFSRIAVTMGGQFKSYLTGTNNVDVDICAQM